MGYSPDFCVHEFTVGQMARMAAMIRKYHKYLYCNYATTIEGTKCTDVPCVTVATSPNCI